MKDKVNSILFMFIICLFMLLGIILKDEEVTRIIGEKSTKELNNIIEGLM